MLKATPFPIAELLPEIRAQLARHPRLVLEAPPGAGKTTQVPLALLDADWLTGKKILVLEPRRIAARAAAEFMAAQLGEAVGETVGYRIRFEAKVSARTRVEVVTEGILTRLIQSDPNSRHRRDPVRRIPRAPPAAISAPHSRSTCKPRCARICLAIMSATLDGERIARWFDAPRLSSAGAVSSAHRLSAGACAGRMAVSSAPVDRDRARETDGDVLVFLPGAARSSGRAACWAQALARG